MKESLIQYMKDFTHNVIVHPLMMFMPSKLAHRMHDANARWCWGNNHVDELYLEGKKSDPETVED